MPTVLASQEAEEGESLEFRRQRLPRAKIMPLHSSLVTEQDSISKKNKTKHMHTYVYCSTVHNSKDLEPTQMPINDRLMDWIKKMWHIYIMEYYAATKKDEFISFVGHG